MFRFRPTVEALDARALPSAVFAGHDDFTPPTVQTAQLADAPADQDDSVVAKKKGDKPQTDHLRITLTDVLVSSVTAQGSSSAVAATLDGTEVYEARSKPKPPPPPSTTEIVVTKSQDDATTNLFRY